MDHKDDALQQLLERAAKDDSLRKEMVADAKGVIQRELGVSLPGEAKVRMVEEAPDELVLILPARVGEVSDDALESVVGGYVSFRAFRSYARRPGGLSFS